MRPILFYLGPIPIRSYGFMVLVGFAIALWYTRRRARDRMAGREGKPGTITPDHVSEYAFKGFWLGIIGARLLYVVMDWGEFAERPQDIFAIWKGGMGAYGAIGTGLLYLVWYCKTRKLNFLEFADLAAPGIALVYGIGRIGCFLNGCCYGAPCNLPWAVSFIRDGHPELGRTPPSHPAQLYSSALNLLWFVILDRWSRRPHQYGEIFLGYLALFFVYRFIYEQFRKGYTADVFVLGLTHAQVFNLIGLPIALYILFRLRRSGAPAPVKTAA